MHPLQHAHVEHKRVLAVVAVALESFGDSVVVLYCRGGGGAKGSTEYDNSADIVGSSWAGKNKGQRLKHKLQSIAQK